MTERSMERFINDIFCKGICKWNKCNILPVYFDYFCDIMSKVSNIVINGNERSIKDVFFSLHPSLCHFAWMIIKRKDEADDIVQDVFLKLCRKQLSFPNETALKAFLYVATKNACVDYIRKQNKHPHSDTIRPDIKIIDDDSDYVAMVIREECFHILENGISSLPPQSRKVMEMHLQGHGNQKIADLLGISINTVKTLKARSVDILRKKLGPSFIILLSYFLS